MLTKLSHICLQSTRADYILVLLTSSDTFLIMGRWSEGGVGGQKGGRWSEGQVGGQKGVLNLEELKMTDQIAGHENERPGK